MRDRFANLSSLIPITNHIKETNMSKGKDTKKDKKVSVQIGTVKTEKPVTKTGKHTKTTKKTHVKTCL